MTKNLTVVLPDALKEEMDKYPEVNWSQVVRTGIENYIVKRSLKGSKK